MSHPSAPQLNLWKKGLGSVPDWVWDRTELETLVLADNGLSEVSPKIGHLQNLRMLDLGHNELTRVPRFWAASMVSRTFFIFTTTD